MSTLLQRLLMTVAILEIPLQIDTYLFYQDDNADVGAIGGLNISLTTFALAGLYALWLVEAALRSEPRQRRIVWGVPLLIYLGTVALSAVAAEKWMLTVFELNILVQAYLLFFYLANRIESRSDLIFVITLFAVAVAMQSFVILGTFRMAYPREFSLGLIRASIHEDGRPAGTLLSPVVAGSYMALLIVPVGSLLFAPVSSRLKAFVLFTVVVGALAIALTQTRGAIITMTVAGMIFCTCLFVRGWLPKWAPAAAVVVALLIAAPRVHVYQNRIQAGDAGSAEARIHLSKIAFHLIEQSPILGGGAGNCNLIAQKIANASPFRSEWFYTVHCKYLLVWVETGILGLAAFLAFLLSTIAQGWRTWRVGDRLLSTVALALAAGIMGHMVHMAVDVFNSRGQVQPLWACAGVIAALTLLREAGAQSTEVEEPPQKELVISHAA